MNVTDPITSAHLGFGEPTSNRREAVTTVRLTYASGQIEDMSLTEKVTHAGPLDALLLLTDRATGQNQGFPFTYEATKGVTLEDYMEPRPQPAS
ncbi:MAG: hypothetical protein ACTIAR_10630 [Brachybacterium tyrofermentans]